MLSIHRFVHLAKGFEDIDLRFFRDANACILYFYRPMGVAVIVDIDLNTAGFSILDGIDHQVV